MSGRKSSVYVCSVCVYACAGVTEQMSPSLLRSKSLVCRRMRDGVGVSERERHGETRVARGRNVSPRTVLEFEHGDVAHTNVPGCERAGMHPARSRQCSPVLWRGP